MNLPALLPLFSQALGRDITPDVEAFFKARAAVGSALNEDGQNFVVENWRQLADFMETDEGKAAIGDFVNAWSKSKVPKDLKKA